MPVIHIKTKSKSLTKHSNFAFSRYYDFPQISYQYIKCIIRPYQPHTLEDVVTGSSILNILHLEYMQHIIKQVPMSAGKSPLK